MRSSLPGGRVRLAAGAVLGLLLVTLGIHLTTPRTEGLEGVWSARAVSGRVVADRAIVSGTNTALDLQTGKTVTLGSVRDGTPFVADDRLIIAGPGRIDSARLDATARWTWRAPTRTTTVPVAAAGGSTLVLTCPAAGTCALIGLDPQGRQDSRSDGIARPAAAPDDGSLPRVAASPVEGGGVLVTDPVSGRTVLRAGRSFVAVPDGPVVTELVQGGQCVVSAYTGTDARWTRSLDGCPETPPGLTVEDGAVTLTWPTRTERLDLANGTTRPAPTTTKAGAKVNARVVARAGDSGRLLIQRDGLAAVESRKTLHSNPFRWGDRLTVIQLHDIATGETPGQVVSDQPLRLLHLERGAVVVRDGDQVIRYRLPDRG